MINGFWSWAIPLWVLVGGWVGTIIIYSKQVVDIDIWKCDVENIDRQREDFDLIVNGFVTTRHNDSISELRLSLPGNSLSPLSKSIQEGANPTHFELRYKIRLYMLEEGRKLQEDRIIGDIAQLCIATTHNTYWASQFFTFPSISTRKENWITTIKKKWRGNTNKVKGFGISRQEYRKFCDNKCP